MRTNTHSTNMDTRKLTSRPGHEPHNQASIYAEDGAGRDVGLTYDDHDGKTAAELVRRWNNHNDLLAALEQVRDFLDAPVKAWSERMVRERQAQFEQMRESTRAAIANATNTH